jgi:hypothetical protein
MTCFTTCPCARLDIVWPACKPAANDDGRIGARTCACARAVCLSALGRGLCPFRRRRRRVRLGHPVCLSRRPACLPPFPPVSPERGGAFCLPRRLFDFRSFSPVTRLRSPVTRRPAIQPEPALPSVATFPLRACQVWGLGVQHRCRQLDDCPLFSTEIQGCTGLRFFFQVPCL